MCVHIIWGTKPKRPHTAVRPPATLDSLCMSSPAIHHMQNSVSKCKVKSLGYFRTKYLFSSTCWTNHVQKRLFPLKSLLLVHNTHIVPSPPKKKKNLRRTYSADFKRHSDPSSIYLCMSLRSYLSSFLRSVWGCVKKKLENSETDCQIDTHTDNKAEPSHYSGCDRHRGLASTNGQRKLVNLVLNNENVLETQPQKVECTDTNNIIYLLPLLKMRRYSRRKRQMYSQTDTDNITNQNNHSTPGIAWVDQMYTLHMTVTLLDTQIKHA